MNNLGKLLIGVTFSALVATSAFAASTTPATAQEAKPSVGAVAPAPASQPNPQAAAPAAPTPAPTPTPVVRRSLVKIGWIDMSKVASESKEGLAMAAKVKARGDELRGKLEVKQKQLEKEKGAIQAKLPKMTPKERAAKSKEFDKKVQEFEKLLTSSREEMQEMQDKYAAEFYKTIRKAAEQYGEENGYHIIVEQKSVLFTSNGVHPTEVTDEIIKELNSKPAQ